MGLGKVTWDTHRWQIYYFHYAEACGSIFKQLNDHRHSYDFTVKIRLSYCNRMNWCCAWLKIHSHYSLVCFSFAFSFIYFLSFVFYCLVSFFLFSTLLSISSLPKVFPFLFFLFHFLLLFSYCLWFAHLFVFTHSFKTIAYAYFYLVCIFEAAHSIDSNYGLNV